MRILLAMPSYGGTAHRAAMKAFYHPLKAPGIKVVLAESQGSLLAQTFNWAWAQALDLYEHGQIDAFAMLHSDNGAEQGFLTILEAERKKAGVDMISVVVPQKDQRGLTSTAVDDTGDLYRVRRLTMLQISQLPETFTDEDIDGKPLLLNTGCWMVKLGPWCLAENEDGTMKHIFTVRDQIRKARKPTGEVFRYAVSDSEDWDFSRQMRAVGLKLAATTVVKVGHHGETIYENDKVWGWETDRQNDDEAREKEMSLAKV